jgi:PTS system mannose-specific IIA component
MTDSGDGVLILTDMFGGTPSNISLSFLEDGRIELVSGVNLPMLIKITSYREGKTLDELARFITEYGQKNIYLAQDVLKVKK